MGEKPAGIGGDGRLVVSRSRPPSGGEDAGFVGGLAGRPAAEGAFAQFIVGPVVGLLLRVDLDQLPGHLVARRTGDGFQLRELGAPR
jgi:hypothetical protein